MGLQGSTPGCSAALSKAGQPPALSTDTAPPLFGKKWGRTFVPQGPCASWEGERAWGLWWEGLRKANRLQMEKMQGRKWAGECCEVQKKVGSTGVDRCTVGRCRH